MRLTLRAELARTHIRAAHQRAEMYPFQAKKELGIKRRWTRELESNQEVINFLKPKYDDSAET